MVKTILGFLCLWISGLLLGLGFFFVVYFGLIKGNEILMGLDPIYLAHIFFVS